MSNEQRNALHEFICASVADCIASIYPRADPRRFREIIDRTKAPASVEETLTDDGYCTRNGCDCPCCEVAHAKLRAISYERACASSAAVHCASSDRRDGPCHCKTVADHAHRIARESCPDRRDDNEDARLAAAAEREYRNAEETVFPALDRLEEDSGAGPARAD